MKKSSRNKSLLILSFSTLIMMFQNCLPANVGVGIRDLSNQSSSASTNPDGQNERSPVPENSFPDSSLPPVPDISTGASGSSQVTVCEGVSCELTPLTKKNAVTTILLALGDKANNQLVVNGNSAQLIAETIVRKSTPVHQPKILVVQDFNIHDEDAEDTTYILDVLLVRYKPHYRKEPISGLQLSDIESYDLIWFNNPGHAMSSIVTYKTLLSYKGGVVLQGDDLSRGDGFNIEELTHLKYIDNGATIQCRDKSHIINDNSGKQYQVQLSSQNFPSAQQGIIQFQYGNDIDLTETTNNQVEILALANPNIEDCYNKPRPAIVRYEKEF